MNRARIAILALSSVFVGSCDNFQEYRVLAVVIHGQLAFVVDPASNDQESCVNRIHISTHKGERARANPAAGDDVQLVANGVFWWKDLEQDCADHFPVFYGQPLKGRRMVYTGNVPAVHPGEKTSVVEAKPLQVGVVYSVDTVSGMLRFGHGWFRIAADQHVENWPNDPVPPVLNGQGYDVSGPYKAPAGPASNVR